MKKQQKKEEKTNKQKTVSGTETKERDGQNNNEVF